jgi:hypothetical protein
MTFSKKFIIVAVAFLASFTACKAHLHGDHHDHELHVHDHGIHHHDHGRLLKKPAKVNVSKPTNPTNGTKEVQEICGFEAPSQKVLSQIQKDLSSLGEINTNDIISVTV